MEAAGELVSGRDTSLLETLGIECLHGKEAIWVLLRYLEGFACVRA